MHDQAVLCNAYGHFDRVTKGFVVTNLKTPRPWINVLSNDRMGVVVSQVGGGFSWYENCQLFRISRWEQDLVQDAMGRFIYVQDLDDPDDLWSTTYQPTRRAASIDTVEHRLGSTTFEREFLGLKVRQTQFVPMEGSSEVWILEIENLLPRRRSIRLASYQELHLGGIGDWHREFHRLFMESRVEGHHLVVWKHPNLPEGHRPPMVVDESGIAGQMAAPIKVGFAWHGADSIRWLTDKATWLGRNGATDRPQGLLQEISSAQTPRWDDPIAAGLVEFSLEPMQSKILTHVVAANRVQSVLDQELDAWDANRAVSELKSTEDYWLERCARNPYRTDDPAVDLMINAWLPYQAIAGRIYAKCAYYQQGGAFGFRDQLQDSLMLLETEPETTLLQLGRHAEAMHEDGAVRHWWHPDSDISVPSRHSDTCLWLAFGLLEYLDSTRDTSVLDRLYSYLPGKIVPVGFSASPTTDILPVVDGEGTLLDHALRGIERTLALRSDRGIPLMLAGDWNDGLSHVGIDGKGESVWVAMFLYHVLLRISPVLRSLGDKLRADRYLAEAASLRTAVNEHAWDGEWFIAGTRDDGKPLGSRHNAEGSIFLNPQTWAVISGIADADRLQTAMNAVRERLVMPYGALLLRPAYKSVDPYVGYISRYAPALRENGGVYSHASTWAIQAFSMLGDQGTAQHIFRGMLPPLRAMQDIEGYAAEPYVMPGNSDGPDSPYAGRAGWTWYTGSAAWMCRIAKRWLKDPEPEKKM